MAGKIVPKKLAKGVDFCGVDKYYYIVRSDLACCLRSTNFTRGSDLKVFSLHPSCRDGDHYLAHKDDLFYIIKGNSYRRVKDLYSDEGAVVYTLHPNCRGGDHYLSTFDYFYIIYQSRGVYRRTTNLNSDEDIEEFTLHPDCRKGFYYFGIRDYYYFVRPQDEWGILYLRTKNYSTNEDSHTFTFHPNVVNFLPGGFGINIGPSYGEWVCIKTISNDSQTPIEWKDKVTKKTGYERNKMSSVENHWNGSSTVSTETGGLAALITKFQFSITAEYGGSYVNTEGESWSEATETEESITIYLQPDQKVYIWTYQLGLGDKPVLYCRDMRIQDDPDPPTDVPLPPAKNLLLNRQ